MSTFYGLGLIGYPLGHSNSPAIHAAFLGQFNLPGQYKLYADADLQKLLAAATTGGATMEALDGLNVTIPHKVSCAPYMHQLSDAARLAGAVNTIVIDREEGLVLSGHNTDIAGIKHTLRVTGKISPLSEQDELTGPAVLLGCGGAARAALVALADYGFTSFVLLVRSFDSAYAMLRDLDKAGFDPRLLQRITVISTNESDRLMKEMQLLGQASVFINATPLGQRAGDSVLPDWFRPLLHGFVRETLVFDMVYAREGLTPITRLAYELGFCKVADGREMLVEQARQAFKLWTGLLPSFQIGLKALDEALSA